jgi:hypothetical protein
MAAPGARAALVETIWAIGEEALPGFNRAKLEHSLAPDRPHPVGVPWEGVERILKTPKTISVVGLSNKRHRESYQIAAYLQEQGYRIIVNPRIHQALGEKAYPTLRDIPTA